MQLGDFKVTSLIDGYFALDGGAMFGVVPRTLWEKTNPPDHRNRIRLALRTLLVQTGDRNILIDTGIGEKFPLKYQEMYAIDHAHGGLMQRLGRSHLDPEDVTDVIITHLHFDHAGGATHRGIDGVLRPSFPAARYYIQKANWDWANDPNDRERASYLTENFAPLAEFGRVNFLEGETELLPGLRVLISNGHTRGQQYVRIDGGGRTLVYPGDIVPTSSHLKVPYTMAYDIEPLLLMEEKRQLLSRAARENWIICFEHDPEIAACTVAEGPGGFVVRETINLEPEPNTHKGQAS